MRKISCLLYFDYQVQEIQYFLENSLNILGFPAKKMYLFFDGSDALEDVDFNESQLLDCLKNGPLVIQVMNGVYGEVENYYWFRLKVDKIYNKVQLEWHNSDLNFMFENVYFHRLLESENFICGYFFDIEDKFQQSLEYSEKFIADPSNPAKAIKVEEKYDTSKNWGRSKSVCGLEFMAAPLMWFGKKFYEIISREKLLNFEEARLHVMGKQELIYIKLFNIDEQSLDPYHRAKQEKFWTFFNLRHIIEKYDDANYKDPAFFLSDYLIKKKR